MWGIVHSISVHATWSTFKCIQLSISITSADPKEQHMDAKPRMVLPLVKFQVHASRSFDIDSTDYNMNDYPILCMSSAPTLTTSNTCVIARCISCPGSCLEHCQLPETLYCTASDQIVSLVSYSTLPCLARQPSLPPTAEQFHADLDPNNTQWSSIWIQQTKETFT